MARPEARIETNFSWSIGVQRTPHPLFESFKKSAEKEERGVEMRKEISEHKVIQDGRADQ